MRQCLRINLKERSDPISALKDTYFSNALKDTYFSNALKDTYFSNWDIFPLSDYLNCLFFDYRAKW